VRVIFVSFFFQRVSLVCSLPCKFSEINNPHLSQTVGMTIILIVVLVLLLGGGGGYYGHSRWGYGGGAGIGLGTILLILLAAYLLGYL